MKRRKIPSKIYYKFDLQEFENNHLERKDLPPDYQYVTKWTLRKIFAHFVYFVLGFPCLNFYLRLVAGLRVKNRKNMKKLKGNSSFFFYMNHTSDRDPYVLQMVLPVLFKKTYIIGYSDALDIPFFGMTMRDLGLLPLPNSVKELRKFNQAILHVSKDLKRPIIVFPEQQMWPYCNYIRPMKDAAFHYPSEAKAPVLPVVTVYKATRKTLKKGKKPRPILVVGEPIYPREDYNIKQNKAYLHEECVKQMNAIIEKYGSYCYIEYIKTDFDDPRPFDSDKISLKKIYKLQIKKEKTEIKNINKTLGLFLPFKLEETGKISKITALKKSSSD